MFFQSVPAGKPDPVFGLGAVFRKDPRPCKVDLMVGIYKDDHLEAKLFPSVRKAKEEILSQDLVADYLPIDGLPSLTEALGVLLFGAEDWQAGSERIYGAHTAGGTAALRAGCEFLAQEVSREIFLPDPTWPNHGQIAERAGLRLQTYPYYRREKKGFDGSAMCDRLQSLPEKSAVLFQASCHNPSGCDPTLEEWRQIEEICRKKKLFPFFDFAYQGLGDGLEADAGAIRLFLRKGHEMIVAYSCSKNFSLYCQRVGALFAVCEKKSVKQNVSSQFKRIFRALYSNPPAHGAKIAAHLLSDAKAKKVWMRDLENARRRIVSMRESLVRELRSQARKTDFSHLQNSKGLFLCVGLTQIQVQRLIDEYGIYLLGEGRINVAGMTSATLPYIVKGLSAVCDG